MHKISIIIPFYNAVNTIIPCINSCLNQTYANIEVVLINDGSTDRSEEVIITEFKERKEIILLHQDNKGASSARNYGLSAASGEFILFLDSDDLLKPEAIELLYKGILNYDIVFGGWEDFDENGVLNTISYQIDLKKSMFYHYFKYKPTVSTALIRKSYAGNWNEDRKIWEVTEFFLKIMLTGARTNFISPIVTSIRQHNNYNRISIQYDHFDPIITNSFFLTCKQELSDKNALDKETEKLIDQSFISFSYEAVKRGYKKNSILPALSSINYGLINKYEEYRFGNIYYFVNGFKGYNGLKLFYLLNKILNRI